MNEPSLDAAIDLLRRLSPYSIPQHLKLITSLAPSLTEKLLETVDQPFKVMRCSQTGRNFLCCDYNRDGDSYRSPWSNLFEPSIENDVEVALPTDRLRDLEAKANSAFDVFRELYYEGGISSAYFWDTENGFAGCVLFKKSSDERSQTCIACWDSIHVFETFEQSLRQTTYRLTSTVILSNEFSFGPKEKVDGKTQESAVTESLAELGFSLSKQPGFTLAGNMVRTLEKTFPILEGDASHIANVGSMIEEIELSMRNMLHEVYFGKTYDTVEVLRSRVPLSKSANEEKLRRDLVEFLGQ